MASLIDRLQRLEAKAAPPSGDSGASPEMDRLLDAIEDARREIECLPPAELPPRQRSYTADDRESDIHFLEEVIPEYRANEGWQSEEAQGLLDAWEEEIETKLEGENR